jgi:hypothetical protein
MLIFEYKKRCWVVWSWELHSGQAEGLAQAVRFILCRQDVSRDDLPTQSWARVRPILYGSGRSDLFISSVGYEKMSLSIGLDLQKFIHSFTIVLCIILRYKTLGWSGRIIVVNIVIFQQNYHSAWVAFLSGTFWQRYPQQLIYNMGYRRNPVQGFL